MAREGSPRRRDKRVSDGTLGFERRWEQRARKEVDGMSGTGPFSGALLLA